MVIDCHVHYEPKIFPLERMLACMEKHGVDKAALITTVCEPFYMAEKGLQKTAGDVMRFSLYHANPLGRVIYGTLVDRKGNFVLLNDKYCIYRELDNTPVAEAIDRYADKFMGWIAINPASDTDPVAELERWSSHPGMVGAKTHPFMHRYPVSRLDSAASWCREKGCPMLIHLGCSSGRGDYRVLPERYPGLRIIYAHAGIPYYRELWSYIRDKEGLYVDLSSPYLNGDLVRKAVDFLGAEKCLYGTDGPYGSQQPGEDYDYGIVKGWIESLPLNDDEFEKIFSANFQGIIES
ncbi:MAG: amidohydrolase family protein [Actinomycetota bacterium]